MCTMSEGQLVVREGYVKYIGMGPTEVRMQSR